MLKSVVLTGGGVKTAAVTATAAQHGAVELVHVDYGQPAAPQQLLASTALADGIGHAKLATYDIGPGTPVELQRSAGTDAKRDDPAGCMMLLLVIGVRHALQVGATEVVTGVSLAAEGADVGLTSIDGRPDRRRQFFHAMSMAAESLPVTGTPVRISAPFVETSYEDIIKLARHLKVSMGATWTCSAGTNRACGVCDTCKARTRAFVKVGIVDPAFGPSLSTEVVAN